MLTTSYRNGTFLRGIRIRVDAPQPAAFANGRISFTLRLAPGETWRGALLLRPDRRRARPTRRPAECRLDSDSPQGRELLAWRGKLTKLETSVSAVSRLFEQAVEDMAALRLPIERDNSVEYLPAAGLALVRRPVRARYADRQPADA